MLKSAQLFIKSLSEGFQCEIFICMVNLSNPNQTLPQISSSCLQWELGNKVEQSLNSIIRWLSRTQRGEPISRGHFSPSLENFCPKTNALLGNFSPEQSSWEKPQAMPVFSHGLRGIPKISNRWHICRISRKCLTIASQSVERIIFQKVILTEKITTRLTCRSAVRVIVAEQELAQRRRTPKLPWKAAALLVSLNFEPNSTVVTWTQWYSSIWWCSLVIPDCF